MDVHDAERDLLLERLPLETVQQVEARIRHLQIELIHGELVEVVEDLVVVAIAGVQDRLRLQALRHDAHRLHEERKLIESGRKGRFVDLDDLGTRGLEGDRLVMEQLREGEAGIRPRTVVFVERPVHHRVRSGDHALHRPLRLGLGEREPIHADRTASPQLVDDDGLLVVPVSVRPNEARDLGPVDVLREVRRHVAPILLAVDEDVDPDLFLESDPFGGRFLLQRPQTVRGELSLRRLGAGAREVLRFREGSHAGRQEGVQAPTPAF